MTTEPRRRAVRAQRLLFWTHTCAYGMLWLINLIIAFQSAGGGFARMPGDYIAILLLWTLAYMIHLAFFVYSTARGVAGGDDRQSYREGFRDGLREAVSLQPQEQQFPDRVMLDDDGELLEPLPNEKSKRR